MKILTTQTLSQPSLLVDAAGQPISASMRRTTIVVAQTAEDVIRELGGQHTALPMLGGKGLTLPTAAEMVRLGLGGQRLLGAETRV